MKNYYNLIFSILLAGILLSCTNDDDDPDTIYNITGTVKGPVSCNTEGKGPAMGIIPENFDLTSGLIITATLPDYLKEEGMRIKFDMIPSNKYITICAAIFAPEQFYEVLNVTRVNEQ